MSDSSVNFCERHPELSTNLLQEFGEPGDWFLRSVAHACCCTSYQHPFGATNIKVPPKDMQRLEAFIALNRPQD